MSLTFKSKYTLFFNALLLSFLLFLGTRLFLFFSYSDYFSSLTLFEKIGSFFMGERVDIIVIFTFTSLFWLIFLLPFKFTFHKLFRALIGILWGIIIAGITLFNIGDSLYFGFVNRHISNELSAMGNDMGMLFEMAKDYYPLQTIVSTLLIIAIIISFYKIFTADIINKSTKKKEWFSIPIVVIIAFLGIRGTISGYSFGTSDAFVVNKVACGNLALNGFFCYYRGGNRENIAHNAITTDDAIKIVKKNLDSEKIVFDDTTYPLMHHYKESEKKPYNVVIVLVESLTGKYLDALSHNNYGVTPNLDKLAHEGILYTNFFANGQRSTEGITSIYTGLTQPTGFEFFGEGLELYNPSFLGVVAHQNGYNTIAMQSSDRGSFRVDMMSHLAGFDDYYGAEDIANTGDEQGHPQFGTWDGNMLRFLSTKLHTMKEPFISFCFTSTTHSPFYLPSKKWAKYPHTDNGEEGYLNTLSYADAKIGEFMERCKKEPWFDNTIFIFTADHVGFAKLDHMVDGKGKADTSLLPDFHIPLIIYAPKIFKPHEESFIASHDDIFPSIVDLLGWKSNFTTISQSLFDPNVKHRFAFVKRGNMIAIADKNGSVGYNYNSFLDEKGKVTKDLKDLLLSCDSAQANLLKKSIWMKR